MLLLTCLETDEFTSIYAFVVLFNTGVISPPPHSTQDPNAQITWENPEEVDLYISKLQKAADKLTSQNRRLRHIHATLTDKVVRLMSVDLLRQQQKWKDTLGEMRTIMANLIQEVLCDHAHIHIYIHRVT